MGCKKIKLNDVTIMGYANGGKGITQHEGKIIFVPLTVKGDVVDLFVYRVRKQWMEAKVTAWKSLSPDRVKPTCVHFGVCGGCKWQMLPYPIQTEIKQAEIVTLFEHHSHLDYQKPLPILSASTPFHYRNKMEFSFANQVYHNPHSDSYEALHPTVGALGLHAPKHYDKIVPLEKCWLMDDKHNHIRNTIYQLAVDGNYTFYNVHTHKGLLRTLQIRHSSHTDEWLLWIVFGEDDAQQHKAFLGELQKSLTFVSEIHYAINLKLNDSTQDLDILHYLGKGYIKEQLGDLSFHIDAKSFFQTNTAEALQLYKTVLKLANPQKTDILYDVYCGMGTIGLFMASQVAQVIGIEVIAEAIDAAAVNTQLNHINNAIWHLGKAEDIINDDFIADTRKADIVVLDPPRAGLHPKLIPTLLTLSADKIVYVSCNPATQVRDIELLSSQYEIVEMVAVDMFPQTQHVENVALLCKKNIR